MRKLKRLTKWGAILVVAYFLITTVYFGYDDIDSRKGVYKFYWSGLKGLWADRPFGFKRNEVVATKLNGPDGPYVIGDRYFYVDDKNIFHEQLLDSTRTITVSTSCKQLPRFTVKLRDSISTESEYYKMPGKLIAISDIEGNFDGFYSFLVVNKIMDKNANWTFGNGHLVLNGDMFDRGRQVTQVLWLIYHLENQAIQNGGKVHFILGNHEIMNMYGDVSYNDFKYMEAAKRVSKQNDWDVGLRYLYSSTSELGRWLRTKNIIEKTGDVIFVHGGLNTIYVKGNYSITELNSIARKYYGIEPTEKALQNERDRPVINSLNSPYWDRRLNFDWKYKIFFMLKGINISAATQKEVDSILNYYQTKKVVIGHSVAEDVSTSYEHKVIKIDVKHGQTINSGRTKGLFIENNTYYKLNDKGTRTPLF